MEDPPEADEAQLQLFHVLYLVIRFVIVNVERQDATSAPQRRLVFVRNLVTHWELTHTHFQNLAHCITLHHIAQIV